MAQAVVGDGPREAAPEALTQVCVRLGQSLYRACREREGHRPRLQGTAIRVAPSWHSALSQNRETCCRCTRVPPVPKWNWRFREDRFGLRQLFSGALVQSLPSEYRSGDPLVISAALWPNSVLGFHTNKP